MAFFKNFLDSLKLEDDDDFDVDEYDNYVSEKKKKQQDKSERKSSSRRAFADDDEDEEEEVTSSFENRKRSSSRTKQVASAAEPVAQTQTPPQRAGFRFANQTPAAPQAPARQASARTSTMSRTTVNGSGNRSAMEVSIMKPTCFEDSQDICDTLIEGKPIIVNLEGFDMELAQRVMDFVSGCVYTLNGKLHQISGFIFIISPDDVDISGDYLALMKQDGFGVPTFNKKF